MRADDIRPYTNLRRGAVGAIRGPRESAQRFSGERRGKEMKGGMPIRAFRMEWTLPRRRRAPRQGEYQAAPPCPDAHLRRRRKNVG